MENALLRALAQGALLLAANRRLARHWRRKYDEDQKASGASAWPAPAIRSWQDWVTESIEALLPDRLTPPEFVERRGWRKVIDDAPLLDHQATAKTAAQAWALCRQYRLSLTHPSFEDAEDTAKFRGWAQEFERRASRHQWLPSASRELWLAEHLPETHREVWLAGFEEITPAQRALLGRLNWRAYEGGDAPAITVTRSGYANSRAEMQAAAKWARTLLETGQAQSVGVVVQNLARLRPAIEAVFEDVLGAPLFNISLGLPLTQWPVVADALLWLRWLGHPLPIGSAGVILRSPFFRGASEERGARAQLDVRLREENVLEVSPARVRANGPPILADSIGRAITLLNAQPPKLPPSAWARFVPTLLATGGWPGDRTQSSPERQALARWQQVLREFAALDLVEGPLPFAQAVGLLADLAGEAIFQPETPEMPVQILEALQAAGSRFDALWVMGMTDTAWPAPPKPNPFLPRELQREFDLPHATPERELRFARDITGRLCRSAPAVVFSYPHREGDEELRPSRLILSYPEQAPGANDYPGYAIGTPLESGKDESAPPLRAGQRVSGGTSVLAWQSQCPFRAFATVRLQAREWPEPQPGLTPIERGIALHGALASLWRQYRTRDSLARLSFQERDAAIAEAVTAGCAALPAAGRERLITLEHVRLARVLAEWVELDFERDGFTVEGVEMDIDLTGSLGLPLRGRADRVDRLPNGELVLIDYKSTSPGKRAWAGPRPDNLQLPLYALAMPERPGAIVFAQLKRGDHKFDGFSSAPELMPRVKPPPQGWDEQLSDWRRIIDEVWTEFEAGRAGVDPKDRGRPCATCHLHSLCRVYDTGIHPQEEAENYAENQD